MTYGISKKVDVTYDEAIERVQDELKMEGFGVLTTIDVKATLKEKLGVDVDRYVILGACNPNMAHQALQMEQELGLLLPCNVIVYEKKGDTFVSAMDPEAVLGIVGNNDLSSVASEVRNMLSNAINRV